jgi:hypothetical protein
VARKAQAAQFVANVVPIIRRQITRRHVVPSDRGHGPSFLLMLPSAGWVSTKSRGKLV